jgi:hypothetical protein
MGCGQKATRTAKRLETSGRLRGLYALKRRQIIKGSGGDVGKTNGGAAYVTISNASSGC